MARQIIVDIVGDSSRFTKSVDDAVASGGKFTNILSGVGLGIGAKAFDLASDAVGAFVGQLGNAAEAYREDQASQAKLANTLRNTVDGFDGSMAAVEAYAAAQQRLGFQDDAIRDSIGQLVGITHDQARAMELNSLAQDLARAKGIDLAAATDIVTKAAQGNGKALKGLGVDIGGATDAAGMLDAIQRNAAGSAEAWAATSDGKLAVSQAKQAEAWEKIGGVVDRITQAVLPIATEALTVIADVISNVATAAEPVVTEIATKLGPVFKTVADFLKGTVIPVVTQVAKTVLPWVWEAAQKLGSIWQAQFRVVGAVIGAAADVIRPIVGTIADVIGGIGRAASDAVAVVRGAVNGVVSFFSGVGARIGSATRGMWDGIWNAFRGVINTLIRGWNSLKFTVPSIDLGPLGKIGGFTIGTPNIPYLHQGGVVPGPPGADVLAILQAGERVVPRGAAATGAPTIVVNINGGLVDGPTIDALTNALARRLRYAPGT
jgi:hypothetical protein